MTSKERVLERERQRGRAAAEALQAASSNMDGTALYAEDDHIPRFTAAKAKMNMLERSQGFVCRSSAGRVVRLIQPYNSDVYPGEPEALPAQWGFVWSKDPAKALPFISLSTSPYQTGTCCIDAGRIWRSRIDNNIWAPSTNPDFWEEVSGGDTDGS